MTNNVITEQVNTHYEAFGTTPTLEEATTSEPTSETESVEQAPETSSQPEAAVDPIGEARLKEFIRREGEMQQQINELKAQAAEMAELRKLKESDPLAALAKVGLNSDDIINRVLGVEESAEDKSAKELLALKAEIDALKAEKQAEKEEITQKTQAQAVLDFKTSILDAIKSNNTDFELCELAGQDAVEKAFAVVEYEFDRTGKVIEINQALKYVEDAYEQEYKKLAAAKKLMSSEVAKKSEGLQDTLQKVMSSPTSLNSKMQSLAPSTPKPFHLSVEDSKRKAAELLKFND